jgi:hypothetical protein
MNPTVEREHELAPEKRMAYLDGELSVADTAAVEQHLQNCADCRHSINAEKQFSTALAMWAVPGLPAAAEARVIAAAKNGLPARGWAPLRRTRNRVLLVAACSAAVLIGVVAWNGSRTPYAAKTIRRISPNAIIQEKTESTTPDVHSYSAPTQELLLRRQQAALASNMAVERDEAQEPPAAVRAIEALPNPQPMIARTVSLVIVAKQFVAARTSLDAVLAKHHGYAAELTINTEQSSAPSLQASLRIPADELAAALVELRKLGEVQTEAQGGEEVTQQHADLTARLKNSRETEQRLQAVLLQRTGRVSDILAVEQEIARVRGEIEQMESEQKGLEHRVSFATVELKLSEEYRAGLSSPSPSVLTRLRNAGVRGFRDAFDSLVSLALFVLQISASLLLWALILVLPLRYVWRRRARWFASPGIQPKAL